MFYTIKPVRLDRLYFYSSITIKKALLEKGFFLFYWLTLSDK